ncbi:YbaN family protein [Clostridium sporogenes]|nr:YbaN family protein [Clostridium sporogenes]UBI13830.1 YbaN family protein [Clostridium sporogenes]
MYLSHRGVGVFGNWTAGCSVAVLPTTPFLLITTYCFTKGSSRFHQWFCNTHIYQKYIENYIKERAMTLKAKLSILIFASTFMIIAFATIHILAVRCFLIGVMLFHWWYFFFRIKIK